MEAKDAVVLGVSFDTVEENAAFADKFSFPFLLLCDTDREIGLNYHAAKTPNQQFADRITYVIGPDGRIARVFEDVDVATHAEEITAGL